MRALIILFVVGAAMTIGLRFLPPPSPSAPVSRAAVGTLANAPSYDYSAVKKQQQEKEQEKGRLDLTAVQRNAVRSARSYLNISGFARQGLIDQLSSEYGNQYSIGDATVAVDSLNVDWNAQAVRSAESYLKMSGFSCRGLIEQLSSEHGNKYTVGQATYGAKQAGAC